jgi:predicted O-linked N-acetylglucosamine transferase (SPINDLY family)
MIPQDKLIEAAQAVMRSDPQGEAPLRELCRHHPESARAHFLLGALLERLGRDEASLAALRRAVELDGDDAQALSATASVLMRTNRIDEAHRLVLAAVERQPVNAQLWANLGAIQEAMDDFPGALSAYDRALTLPDAPMTARMNRGYALTRLGRLDEALENNRLFAELQPQNADAHFNVAEVLMALHRPEEALAACDAALRLAAEHAKAMILRGLALSCLERFDEARAALDLVRARHPEAVLNFVNAFDPRRSDDPDRFDPELVFLSAAYQRLHDCDWSQRTALLARLEHAVLDRIRAGRGLADPGLAYNALTLPLKDELRLAIARGVSGRIESTLASLPAVAPARSRTEGKLRIGYLSPDFREHLNAYLLRPLIELHDRSRFEVTCYSTGPADRSRIRQRVEAAADRFVDVSRLDDAHIAAQIRADEIDVLVDAGGYTTYSRPGVPVRRPAPVQVSYLAFPGTQAMDAVPWRIVDRIASPPEQRQAWTEALVYLPDTFFIYDRSEPLSFAGLSRKEYRLADEAFVFCSFNNYYKIEPEIFGVWMEILRDVPASVLWLAGRNASAAANLRKEARQRGIPEERLVFAPFESRERYRARFALADLFLDTPLFNAMTTACDALAAGLPLLSAAGSSFPSRVAASLLVAAGFREGIVDSLDAYRKQAVEWGGAPGVLRRLRQDKLANPFATPLFDTAGRVRQLETAYEEMWRRHRLGLAPESFDVMPKPARTWRNSWY